MNKKSFTIVELVIIITVLVILIGIALPNIYGMKQAASITRSQKELQTYQAAVESFYTFASPQAYPGVAGSGTFTLGASYLVTANPQIITTPLYDPFNLSPLTEYYYRLSANGQYYVIASEGPHQGVVLVPSINNSGSVSLTGHWFCVTNGTGC